MALSGIGRKHLLEHGTQVKLSKRFGCSAQFISNVVAGEMIPKTREGWKRYRRVQKAVARELNLTLEEAFSEYERGGKAEEMVA